MASGVRTQRAHTRWQGRAGMGWRIDWADRQEVIPELYTKDGMRQDPGGRAETLLTAFFLRNRRPGSIAGIPAYAPAWPRAAYGSAGHAQAAPIRRGNRRVSPSNARAPARNASTRHGRRRD